MGRAKSRPIDLARELKMGVRWYGCLRFFREEHAVTSVEYAMLAVLITTVCAAAVTALSSNLLNLYTTVCKAVSNAVFGSPIC